jgi:hypothetical protein
MAVVVVVVAAAAAAISIICLYIMTGRYPWNRQKKDVWTLSASYTRRYLARDIYIYI